MSSPDGSNSTISASTAKPVKSPAGIVVASSSMNHIDVLKVESTGSNDRNAGGSVTQGNNSKPASSGASPSPQSKLIPEMQYNFSGNSTDGPHLKGVKFHDIGVGGSTSSFLDSISAGIEKNAGENIFAVPFDIRSLNTGSTDNIGPPSTSEQQTIYMGSAANSMPLSAKNHSSSSPTNSSTFHAPSSPHSNVNAGHTRRTAHGSSSSSIIVSSNNNNNNNNNFSIATSSGSPDMQRLPLNSSTMQPYYAPPSHNYYYDPSTGAPVFFQGYPHPNSGLPVGVMLQGADGSVGIAMNSYVNYPGTNVSTTSSRSSAPTSGSSGGSGASGSGSGLMQPTGIYPGVYYSAEGIPHIMMPVQQGAMQMVYHHQSQPAAMYVTDPNNINFPGQPSIQHRGTTFYDGPASPSKISLSPSYTFNNQHQHAGSTPTKLEFASSYEHQRALQQFYMQKQPSASSQNSVLSSAALATANLNPSSSNATADLATHLESQQGSTGNLVTSQHIQLINHQLHQLSLNQQQQQHHHHHKATYHQHHRQLANLEIPGPVLGVPSGIHFNQYTSTYPNSSQIESSPKNKKNPLVSRGQYSPSNSNSNSNSSSNSNNSVYSPVNQDTLNNANYSGGARSPVGYQTHGQAPYNYSSGGGSSGMDKSTTNKVHKFSNQGGSAYDPSSKDYNYSSNHFRGGDFVAPSASYSTITSDPDLSNLDIRGNVCSYCMDQFGSRHIQQLLAPVSSGSGLAATSYSMELRQLIYDEVLPNSLVLIANPFGNYVLQKLFEVCTPQQCQALANTFQGRCYEFSMQTFGCRVIQKALEYVEISKALEIVSEFEVTSILPKFVEDSNGNHVVQKCIQVVCKAARVDRSYGDVPNLLESRLNFIVDYTRSNVVKLAHHPYGVRVIQSILENCCTANKNSILQEIRTRFVALIPDCYGNYLIQSILEYGSSQDRLLILKEILDHLFEYSLQKYSSNVVEKCLLFCDKRSKDSIVWKIINFMSQPVPLSHAQTLPGEEKSPNTLDAMLKDQYANYVVQRVLDICDEKQFMTLFKYVKDNSAHLKKFGYGKHIIGLLEKRSKEKI